MLFKVARTVGNNLPVFRTFSRNGTLASTWVRKVQGNRRAKEALMSDLRIITRAEVEDTVEGIRIKGDHRQSVKNYLQKLGF